MIVSSECFDRPGMTEQTVRIELFSTPIYIIIVSLILMQQHLRRSEEGYVNSNRRCHPDILNIGEVLKPS